MRGMGGGGGGCGFSVNEYSCAHGAQKNFGYLIPYLTYGRREPDYKYQAMCVRQQMEAGKCRYVGVGV